MKRAKAHGPGAADAPRRRGPAMCKSEGGCGVVVRVHARLNCCFHSSPSSLQAAGNAFLLRASGSVLHNSPERKPRPAFLCVCA